MYSDQSNNQALRAIMFWILPKQSRIRTLSITTGAVFAFFCDYNIASHATALPG